MLVGRFCGGCLESRRRVCLVVIESPQQSCDEFVVGIYKNNYRRHYRLDRKTVDSADGLRLL